MDGEKENRGGEQLPPKTIYTVSAGFKCLELLYKKNVDLYLCYCGIEECSRGHSFGPAVREDYLIHFITSGRGTYRVRGETFALGKGDYFLIRPGEETFYQADRMEPWSYAWVGFNGIKAPVYMDYLRECSIDGALTGRPKGLGEPWRTGHCDQVEQIRSLVTGMLESKALTYANELRREGLLYQLLSVLAEQKNGEERQGESGEYPQQVYVEHVLRYVEDNYAGDIRVGRLTQEMGLSRSYLSSCFKKATGEAIKDYLTRFRMEKAEKALEETDIPVGQIACEIGYEDALAFSKAFKKKNGTSPSEYRRISRKNRMSHERVNRF